MKFREKEVPIWYTGPLRALYIVHSTWTVYVTTSHL